MLKHVSHAQPLGRTMTMLFILPVSLLSASCATVSAEMPDPRRCSRYTEPFLQETPHAPRPAQKSMPAWVEFGVAQTGQLVVANDDKRKAKHVQDTCEAETAKAYATAARKLKPWYKRIF